MSDPDNRDGVAILGAVKTQALKSPSQSLHSAASSVYIKPA